MTEHERTTRISWAKATPRIHDAAGALVECLRTGRNCWLETREVPNTATPVIVVCSDDAPFDVTAALDRFEKFLLQGIHDSLTNDKRERAAEWIDEYGTSEFFTDYQSYLAENMFGDSSAAYVTFADAVKAYFMRDVIMSDDNILDEIARIQSCKTDDEFLIAVYRAGMTKAMRRWT